MSSYNKHIQDLIAKAVDKTATLEELDELLFWFSDTGGLKEDFMGELPLMDWDMLVAASKRETAKSLSAKAIDRMAVRILNSEAAKSGENSHLIPENEPKSKSGSGLNQHLNDDQDQNLADMDINRNGQQPAQPETTSDSKPVAKPEITQEDKAGSSNYSNDPDRAVEQAGTWEEDNTESRHRPLYAFKWRRAAGILIILGLGALSVMLLFNRQNRIAAVKPPEFHQTVRPGSNKAILTLDNGKTIDLSSDASGLLATEGSVQVKKVQAGKLVYSEDGSAGADKTKPGGTASASHINTLSTPRGGKYMAVLPDGTKVWLNAASSISFPTRFAKDTRMVSMSGEAYFEVAKEPSRPFIVKTGSNLQVRVYGTHFNINDFGPKGRCKTTLLEGSVSVTRGDDSLRLKPGQQAVATTRGKVVLNRHVDLSEVIGWKNDLFYFKQEGIHGIMNRISLWYDVDIRYQGPLPTDKFSAIISRNKSLSELLSILKEAGKVDFQVQGRTVVVSRRAGI